MLLRLRLRLSADGYHEQRTPGYKVFIHDSRSSSSAGDPDPPYTLCDHLYQPDNVRCPQLESEEERPCTVFRLVCHISSPDMHSHIHAAHTVPDVFYVYYRTGTCDMRRNNNTVHIPTSAITITNSNSACYTCTSIFHRPCSG